MTKTTGISILAIGKPKFMHFAFQMAMSIKYHSPDIPIQLIVEEEIKNTVSGQFFDVITIIDKKDCYTNFRIDPGKAKVSIYKYLHFDNTLYLDVDGFVIRDIQDLIDECQGKEYACQGDKMHWAKEETIRQYYGIPEDSPIHGLNSSFQWITKGKTCQTIFDEAVKAFNNPIPQKEMTNNWFNRVPDELYISVGMAKAGITEPYITRKYPVYFRTRKMYGDQVSYEQLTNDYYVIGTFGNDKFNHLSIHKYYNSQMQKVSLAMINDHLPYKLEHLMEKKA